MTPKGQEPRTRRAVTRADWKLTPPRAMQPIPYSGSFSASEYERIRRGLFPESMDDKWFIYWENHWLSMHRSWTGKCVYQVRFRRAGERFAVAEALVCGDGDTYRRDTDNYETRFLDWLIRTFLLEQDCNMPLSDAFLREFPPPGRLERFREWLSALLARDVRPWPRRPAGDAPNAASRAPTGRK